MNMTICDVITTRYVKVISIPDFPYKRQERKKFQKYTAEGKTDIPAIETEPPPSTAWQVKVLDN